MTKDDDSWMNFIDWKLSAQLRALPTEHQNVLRLRVLFPELSKF